MSSLVYALQSTPWSLFTINLSSSYQAWGLGHLDRDTNEIAQCVTYVNEYKQAKYGAGGKLILMGHSTGSQDVLHYLYRQNPHTSQHAFDEHLQHVTRPAVDGAVLQAPVSDREAIQWVLANGISGRSPAECRGVYDQLVSTAKTAVAERHGAHDFLLPLSLTSQIGYPATHIVSARRFLSLVSPDSPSAPQEDDLFSSDLSDEHLAQTFGLIHERGLLRHKLLVLPSGADQAVPDWVDKEAVLARWRNALDGDRQKKFWDGENSGPVPNASHALSNDDQDEPRRYLVGKVQRFLSIIENGELSEKGETNGRVVED